MSHTGTAISHMLSTIYDCPDKTKEVREPVADL
jgi:hypothetical protein